MTADVALKILVWVFALAAHSAALGMYFPEVWERVKPLLEAAAA